MGDVEESGRTDQREREGEEEREREGGGFCRDCLFAQLNLRREKGRFRWAMHTDADGILHSWKSEIKRDEQLSPRSGEHRVSTEGTVGH